MSSENAERKSGQPVLVGVLLVCAAIGGVALLGSKDDLKYHLETTNNVIRRWNSCPVGAYAVGPGRDGCVCKKCPAGHRCLGGSRSKVRCRPGKYQDQTGQNVCKPARRGRYVRGHGASRDTPCPFGAYTNALGTISCTLASKGHHVPSRGSRTQTKCRPGKYQNVRGQRFCKNAPAGSYVNTHGATRATPCNFGTYQNRVGQTSCRNAPRGYFVGSRGRSSPTPCRAGTYQSCHGQMNCIQCPPGTRSGPRSTRCTTSVNTCGVRAAFAFACPRARNPYRLNRPRGIGGNTVRGPMVFTGGLPSTLSNSNRVFPRPGGDLSVVVQMRFDARMRHDWVPVVNKILNSRLRYWGFWVHPTPTGRGTHVLLQRYVGGRVHVHTTFNLRSRTQPFTIGFTCQARGFAVLYVNGQAKARARCANMYVNYPLRVGGSIRRVHSWLKGTIYKLSLFDRALSAAQMNRVMTNRCNQC